MSPTDALEVRRFAGAAHAMHARLLVDDPNMTRDRALDSLQRAMDEAEDERLQGAWRAGGRVGPRPEFVLVRRRREREEAAHAVKARRRAAKAHAAKAARIEALQPFERLVAIHGRQPDGSVRVPFAMLPFHTACKFVGSPVIARLPMPSHVRITGTERALANADLGAAGELPAPPAALAARPRADRPASTSPSRPTPHPPARRSTSPRTFALPRSTGTAPMDRPTSTASADAPLADGDDAGLSDAELDDALDGAFGDAADRPAPAAAAPRPNGEVWAERDAADAVARRYA